jgi:hypothetical protein
MQKSGLNRQNGVQFQDGVCYSQKPGMSGRLFITPESQHAALRQLKILVVVLIVSNVGLGIFSVYLLRAVDRKYSVLISETVPSINELQTLTAWSVDAMRGTNPILFQEPAGDAAATAQHSRSAIEHERDLRSHALQREWLVLKPAERKEMETTGETFTRESLAVLQLFEGGRKAEAVQKRDSTLRPAFDRYLRCLTKSADLLEVEGLRTSGNLTQQTGSLSHMMLGVATWPVMVVGLFFLVAMIYIVGVLFKVLVFPPAET